MAKAPRCSSAREGGDARRWAGAGVAADVYQISRSAHPDTGYPWLWTRRWPVERAVPLDESQGHQRRATRYPTDRPAPDRPRRTRRARVLPGRHGRRGAVPVRDARWDRLARAAAHRGLRDPALVGEPAAAS